MSDALVEARDGILIITINRPDAKNAMNKAASELIAAALDRLDAEDDLRVGIVTGAGGTFCSGMDLKALATGFSDEEMARMAEDPDLHWKALLRHGRPNRPVRGATRGP